MTESLTLTTARSLLRPALAMAALLALVLALLPATQQAAEAFPFDSHCGTETGDTSVEGFIDHAELGQRLTQIEQSSQGRVQVEVAGHSFHGREIWAARVGHGDTVMLVQSEIHGNEKHGTIALLDILKRLGNGSKRSQQIREAITFVAIPKMNPDGAELDRRRNDMSWDDVISVHPQLAGTSGAWYHSSFQDGFDVNRDFHADLDYEPVAADLPGSSSGFGFYITPAARTVREVYRDLENEFGRVDVFVDLHNQAPCYGHGLPAEVEVEPPSPAEGSYEAAGASFGPGLTEDSLSADIVLVDDGSADPTEGCDPLQSFPAGAIALVDRGSCTFVQKVNNAQDAGAVAVIVANNVAGTPFNMGGSDPDIEIPSVMISREDGEAIKDGLPATGRVRFNPDSQFYTPLSISGRFLTDPTAHGDWPDFDDDASRRANVAVYDALQGQGGSPFGKVTRYPQPPGTNIPGTALGSFSLRGSAVVLFETSGQTQQWGQKRIGMLARQVEVGLGGIIDALADDTFDDIDPDRYGDIPLRVSAPSN